MKHALLIILFFSLHLSAQEISGIVVADGVPLSAVLVINIDSGAKTQTNAQGNFTIVASVGNELRFVKSGYERSAVKISIANSRVFANLVPALHEIEEVKVNPVRLTGDLNKDALLLAKRNKTEELQKEIGLPTAPEKPREEVAEVKKDILLPILKGKLNIQAIYDVVSGDAKRKKKLYKFQDMQSDVQWLLARTDADYYTSQGIPENRINEFIEFSFTQNPKVRTYIQARNISGALAQMEEVFPIFIKRLKQ
ncbi:MAG: carboxypeptidase-like regulatory domain-containing protein [Cruoricaptor ignavus]|nr:carboxypeptidase-like regulatory domain-containing protein [Cruoricaptor ignavus]